MNSISVNRHRSAGRDTDAVYDVGGCIRSWGQRGMLAGGASGLVLGAMFVASPLTTNTLAFGTIGTLAVCVIECAVLAGGIGALLAAVTGPGVLRGRSTGLSRSLDTGRPPSHTPIGWAAGNRGVSPDRLASPVGS